MSNHTPETITIQLTRGYSAIVDKQDADLTDIAWYTQNPTKTPYAARQIYNPVEKRQHTVLLHRIIAERLVGRYLTNADIVDHINLQTMDNRRENLRVTNRTGNAINRSIQSNNKSGYKGVSFHEGKWRARISLNRKGICLGHFNTPEEAYEAYCKAAKELHGEFARLE